MIPISTAHKEIIICATPLKYLPSLIKLEPLLNRFINNINLINYLKLFINQKIKISEYKGMILQCKKNRGNCCTYNCC